MPDNKPMTPEEFANHLMVESINNRDRLAQETMAELITARDESIRREAKQEEELKKDVAYSERDRLVCALSKLFPASLERHPDEDVTWEDDWRWVVFIDLPAGQATWHIHDTEVPMFKHLQILQGRKWDGHTTTEKYQRLRAIPIDTPPAADRAPEAVYGTCNANHTPHEVRVECINWKPNGIPTPEAVCPRCEGMTFEDLGGDWCMCPDCHGTGRRAPDAGKVGDHEE